MKKGEWESSGTIIIPQRGETELTLNCIEGLRRFDTRDWRIIVVSDGCPEDERIRLNCEFENDSLVTVLNRSHAGVTASWNAGIECAESEFLVLLNNDTVCRGDWGEALRKPVLENRAWISGVQTRIEPEVKRFRGCQGLSGNVFEGWCLAFCKRTWEILQGFDESLTMYWSDTDFQLRGAMLFGSWNWLSEGLVQGLPLRHLGHRTAHSSELLSESRSAWGSDRRVFRRKWRGILQTAALPNE